MEGTLVAQPLTTPSLPVASREGAWASPEPLRALFGEVASGRSEALGEIYDLVAGRLYGLALWRTGNREDASDVVQETFVRLARSRETLEGIRDPRGWLLRVAHRLSVDAARRSSRHPAESLDEHAGLLAPSCDEASAVDARRATALLARLSAAQREVVYLRHFAEMTFSEMARNLGIPTFTAASRYRLALFRLRRLMGGPR